MPNWFKSVVTIAVALAAFFSLFWALENSKEKSRKAWALQAQEFRLAMSNEEWARECDIVEKLTKAIPGETLIVLPIKIYGYQFYKTAVITSTEDGNIRYRDDTGALGLISLADEDQKILTIKFVLRKDDLDYGRIVSIFMRRTFAAPIFL